jgi:3-deoxy-D-manno-octulosonic-acid transferase
MYQRRTFSQFLAFCLYDLLLFIAYVPVTIKWGLWRQFYLSHKRYQRRGQRYGDIAEDLQPAQDWFHCVSVGEVVAASCVVKALLVQHPERRIMITTTTPTGAGRVRDIFGDALASGQVQHHYLPWDLPWLIGAFVKACQPQRVFITEVELWPNMIIKLAKRNIPVMIINARMSEKSAQKYQQLSLLSTPVFANISHVCAQGERDHEVYQSLGFGPERLTLTHNIKFDQVADISIPEHIATLGEQLASRFVIVAGSTHQGEETHWLDVLNELHAELDMGDVLLVLVPRHPERFGKVIAEVKEQEIAFQQFSLMTELASQTKVLIVDAMGVLTPLYHCADLAFVGGSLVARGGHNALEPAYFGVPMLMGPHTFNNPVICQTLQDAEALHITQDVSTGVEFVTRYYDDKALAKRHGDAGQQVLRDNRGALQRTLAVMQSVSEELSVGR